jgi:hypothetical protein
MQKIYAVHKTRKRFIWFGESNDMQKSITQFIFYKAYPFLKLVHLHIYPHLYEVKHVRNRYSGSSK